MPNREMPRAEAIMAVMQLGHLAASEFANRMEGKPHPYTGKPITKTEAAQYMIMLSVESLKGLGITDDELMEYTMHFIAGNTPWAHYERRGNRGT